MFFRPPYNLPTQLSKQNPKHFHKPRLSPDSLTTHNWDKKHQPPRGQEAVETLPAIPVKAPKAAPSVTQ